MVSEAEGQRSKLCSKCGQVKPIQEYHRDSSKTDGFRKDCKKCACAQKADEYREWRADNPMARKAPERIFKRDIADFDWAEVVFNYMREKRSDSRNFILVSVEWDSVVSRNIGALAFFRAMVLAMNLDLFEAIQYLRRSKDDPGLKARTKEYNNRPDVAARRAALHADKMKDPEYVERNRKRGRDFFKNNKEKFYAYRKEQRRTNPHYRIAGNLRTYIYQRIGGKVNNGRSRFRDIVGCTIEELKAHLEAHFQPGMTWENYGMLDGTWSIDHTRPCASFDLSKEDQQKECFNFNNLKPMWWRLNLMKSDRMPESLTAQPVLA